MLPPVSALSSTAIDVLDIDDSLGALKVGGGGGAGRSRAMYILSAGWGIKGPERFPDMLGSPFSILTRYLEHFRLGIKQCGPKKVGSAASTFCTSVAEETGVSPIWGRVFKY
jgi:hypothetical protein